ncbi:efflux RND transporter periplasmic adaptor subunit [Ancylobacter sp. 6x-1]|uniref:Efflux RND transporter periplasmic adaptor subunit n=1 Tax=Ancylobacter crimeensis TaxID=2579147 RepID=A0ABT0D9A2_9HYPH|nr:efflux RND transporter periplasmic adaptor subunit [Ancylobacter crimeensis]MCK0196520.1 efflux RND transporter periplasmic adaptor subunit [Ancylobacter crimeensis]
MNEISRLPSGSFRPATRLPAGIVLALALLGAGCSDNQEAAKPDPRPVRTVTVEQGHNGDTVSLTGDVQAEDEVSLAFRVSGRMIERLVNVGDTVKAGQVIGRLDPQNAQNSLRSAQAAISAAEGRLVQAQNHFDRQQRLLSSGFTTRANFDDAQQGLRSATAALDDAAAQLKIAQDNLGYTELLADAPGVVTGRGAEPGEVAQAGQMIVQLARKDGRDAVFDVPASLLRAAPADPVVTVSLTDDPSVKTTGRVREVSPQADPVTRTFRVRVGLDNPPAAMRLGASVAGRVELEGSAGISVPASALTAVNDRPAVWVVDPKANTVALRNVEIARFNPATVSIASGLAPGDVVVTAGVQALHPGQAVRLLGAGS